MYKIFLKNKRSQVGITITWFFAFIVIFFIMLLFTGMVASIALKKGVGKNEIVSVEDGFRKIENHRELVIFLNSPIIVDGKSIKVKDEILVLIEPYLNKELMKQINMGDINDLNLKRFMIQSQETQKIFNLDFRKENSVIEILRKNFDNSCTEYILKFPFGYFYRYKDKNYFVEDLKTSGVSDELDKLLGDFVVIKIPYKNQNIEIKLKSRYIC